MRQGVGGRKQEGVCRQASRKPGRSKRMLTMLTMLTMVQSCPIMGSSFKY